MKLKSILIIGLFLLTIVLFVDSHSQELSVSKAGITAAPFLEIGVGARAIGMGGAFVATANDASALYWNPAGIARIPKMHAILMHADWIADINYDFAGFCLPLADFGALGAAITALGSGDMIVRTEDRPEGTGEIFSANDLAVALSYARGLTDRFAIGFNVKYIHQRISHSSAQGYAVDFGTLFVTGFHGMRIGASLNNFGTEMRMEGKDLLVFYDVNPHLIGNNDKTPADLKTEKWPLPLTFQFGIAMELFQTQQHRLTVAIDALHPSDNTEYLNLGMELGFRDMLFLRMGYRELFLRDAEQGLSLGGGAITKFGNLNLHLDYAWSDFGRLQSTQRFTIEIAF